MRGGEGPSSVSVRDDDLRDGQMEGGPDPCKLLCSLFWTRSPEGKARQGRGSLVGGGESATSVWEKLCRRCTLGSRGMDAQYSEQCGGWATVPPPTSSLPVISRPFVFRLQRGAACCETPPAGDRGAGDP